MVEKASVDVLPKKSWPWDAPGLAGMDDGVVGRGVAVPAHADEIAGGTGLGRRRRRGRAGDGEGGDGEGEGGEGGGRGQGGAGGSHGGDGPTWM